MSLSSQPLPKSSAGSVPHSGNLAALRQVDHEAAHRIPSGAVRRLVSNFEEPKGMTLAINLTKYDESLCPPFASAVRH
jgi:hypothetical protein